MNKTFFRSISTVILMCSVMCVYSQQRDLGDIKSWLQQHPDFVLIEDTDFASAYVICDHEVTQAEYRTVMGRKRSVFPDDDLPVTTKRDDDVDESIYGRHGINVFDAMEYCNALSLKEGLTPCYTLVKKDNYGKETHDNYWWTVRWNQTANGYRLPTHNEWMYAARGGNKSKGYKYAGSDNINDVAWYAGNSNGKIQPVKQKKPNELGLYDMIGNAWEWCYNTVLLFNNYGGSGTETSLCGYCFLNSAPDSIEDAYKEWGGRDGEIQGGFRVVRNAAAPRKVYASAAEYIFVEGNNMVSPFYICDHEVTQAEFRTVMNGYNPSYRYIAENVPVNYVSWHDAVEYCNALSKKEGRKPCYTIEKDSKEPNEQRYWKVTWNKSANGYRLPTENEWEWAAKGGKMSKGYKYSGSDNLDDIAWYKKNTGNRNVNEYRKYFVHASAVKTKKPNELGIYDMTGNVWEWCWNWYESLADRLDSLDLNPGKDYDGPAPAKDYYKTPHLLRGGSFTNEYNLEVDTDDWKNAKWRRDQSGGRSSNYGFRVVRSGK
ncbi:MAG: SUMF1/EgtB/PvdO family nonheme iron enzyme [Spirochaetales bacterium]|nr:SUMF1/EgtB/PvdO family nonheme iron enzyme [Spirochaetales bacterium]